MRCLILLLLVGSAFAQPVTGPFEVHRLEDETRFYDIEIAVHNDTCEIVYLRTPQSVPEMHDRNMSLSRIPFFMSTHSPDWEPLEYIPAEQWNWSIEEVYADETGNWAICASGSDDFDEESGYFRGQRPTRTALIRGHSDFVAATNLNQDTLDWYGCDMGYLNDQRISRFSGGYLISSRYSGCQWLGSFGEPWAYIMLHRFDNNFTLDSAWSYCDQSCASEYGPWWTTANAITADTITIISHSNFGNALTLMNGSNEPQDLLLDCLPEQDLQANLYRTNSDALLTVVADSIFRVSTNAECLFIASQSGLMSRRAAFHPDFGFSTVAVNPQSLMLTRIDTNGIAVQPVGVLYETDGTSFIVDADVTISDSGKVIAVWSEYTDWNEGPHVLKIAWTDWTTYLDTPEQQAPAIPSQISLSSYPNPFNSTVTIKYALPQASRVSLSIFDIRGRLVETLRDNFTPSGSHTQSWSPTDLASGVYFVRLNANTVLATSKLLYLK